MARDPRRRRFVAVYAVHAGVLSTTEIGRLRDQVALLIGLPSEVRLVRIAPNTGRHLTRARGGASIALYCARNLPALIESPSHFSRFNPETGRFAIVGMTEDKRRIIVALKLVTAARASSGSDEIWVSTAHDLGRESWPRYQRTRGLIAIQFSSPD